MKMNRGYWTKERCYEEALKYNSSNDLKINNNYVYEKSYKEKWLEEFYENYLPKIISKERCHEEALKYKSRKEFSNNSKPEYTKALKASWLDDICLHMIRKPKSFWTKERCHEEALKYNTRTEFKKKSYQAYKFSKINCWFDDICSHMTIVGNMYKRCIYAFEFEDNYVYIGLTYNIDKRSESHYKSLNSQVNKHILRNNIQPILNKLTEYIDVEEAKIKEHEYIELYKNKGWYVLNIQKAGNTGGIRKVSEQECYDIISKYKSLYEFRKKETNIYKYILRYEWKHLLDNLERMHKENGYFTKDKCKEIALMYNRRIDFFKNDYSAYNTSQKNGWIDSICEHMYKKDTKSKGYWTDDKCLDEASKYTTKKDFRKMSPTAYVYCNRRKLMNLTNLI